VDPAVIGEAVSEDPTAMEAIEEQARGWLQNDTARVRVYGATV
jgi:hypothetical protein